MRHSDHLLPTGVRLHVTEAGALDAPPLLAVHGWPQHSGMWRAIVPVLSVTHRVICPDLRGFGRSGQPADGDFTKARLADDLLALLDVLGIEQAGYLGHDWGGWTGWLVGIRAPTRISKLMAVSIIHPWTPRTAALANAWRIAYQYPLAAPRLGPAVAERFARMALGRSMDAEAAAVYADELRDPARAKASSLLYRHFHLRELPALAAGALDGARLEMPVKVLFGRDDPAQHPSQLGGLDRHASTLDVEIVDGGHFLVDERPELVADRARTWFA